MFKFTITSYYHITIWCNHHIVLFINVCIPSCFMKTKWLQDITVPEHLAGCTTEIQQYTIPRQRNKLCIWTETILWWHSICTAVSDCLKYEVENENKQYPRCKPETERIRRPQLSGVAQRKPQRLHTQHEQHPVNVISRQLISLNKLMLARFEVEEGFLLLL